MLRLKFVVGDSLWQAAGPKLHHLSFDLAPEPSPSNDDTTVSP